MYTYNMRVLLLRATIAISIQFIVPVAKFSFNRFKKFETAKRLNSYSNVFKHFLTISYVSAFSTKVENTDIKEIFCLGVCSLLSKVRMSAFST